VNSNGLFALGLALVGIFAGLFVLLFLAGLASAALEIRRERRAGLIPTRPAWENRAKRRALGGLRGQVAAAWASARHKRGGVKTCWCGLGPIVWFTALDAYTPAGYGCAAVEAGHPLAINRHDAAGGYRRVEAADGLATA